MDRHAYHTFQILDHVEKTPLVTNRLLAAKLNVSVKLAHGLLKQLVTKGLLHIHKRNSRRWDYFLTPKGIAEKARITYEFLDFSMQFYREARRRSAHILGELRRQGIDRIAFLGATELAEIAFLGLQEHRLILLDVYDDSRAGNEFLGIKVRPIQDVVKSAADKILVTAFDPAMPMGERYMPDGADRLLCSDAGESPANRLVWLFDAAATPPGRQRTSTKEEKSQ